jgi:hypothetical protein
VENPIFNYAAYCSLVEIDNNLMDLLEEIENSHVRAEITEIYEKVSILLEEAELHFSNS